MSEESEEIDHTICFCHNVPASAIKALIRSGKVKNLAEIQAECHASTGCGGCEFEVIEILEEEQGQKQS